MNLALFYNGDQDLHKEATRGRIPGESRIAQRLQPPFLPRQMAVLESGYFDWSKVRGLATPDSAPPAIIPHQVKCAKRRLQSNEGSSQFLCALHMDRRMGNVPEISNSTREACLSNTAQYIMTDKTRARYERA